MVGNEAPIALDWVKRIEFVPGPASALYGGNALFGVANAVLWSGADLNGSRVSAETGSAGTRGISALSGRQLEDGADWVAGVSAWRRDGENLYYPEFEARGIPDGKARGLDGERYLKAFAKYSKHGWRFLATYSNRYKNVPTAYFGTVPNAPGTNNRDEHLHLDLTNSTALSQNWSQLAHLQLGAYTYRADYVYSASLNRDYTLNTWWDAEYQLTYTGFNAHKLLFGGEVRRSPHLDQYNYDVSPATSWLNDQRSSTATGLYVQDEWRLSSRWLANLGGRLDHVSDAGTFGSPRLALIYQPQTATTAKFIYGRAFRAPNAYERFYTVANFSQGNANLKPEHIETREISLDHALTPATRVGISHYRYTIHNLIDQIIDSNNIYQYINQNDMRARGWELEAESLIGLGWRVRGSVAWQRVEQDGGESINSPHRLGKLFVDGPIFDGWTGAFELQAMSRRQAMVGALGGNTVARMTLRQSRQGPYGQWSLVVNNLANRTYADPSSQGSIQNVLPQDRRQWLIRWEYAL
jgi:iron complex outermembrane receptor protein